jgi:hypothetical protein
MRKFAGVLLAAALVLPVGLIASPAGAVAGATCKTFSGTATVKPGLPATTAKVKPVITTKNAKLAGCTGGVASGLFSGSLKGSVLQNCAGLAKQTNFGLKGTATVVWNTKATSTISWSLTPGPKGKITTVNLPGTVTAGLFKGSKMSGQVIFTFPKGQCGTTPLTSTTVKQVTNFVI